MDQQKKRKFIIDVAFAAVILLLLWFVLKYLFFWILPFILGYLIAVIMQPVVRLLHERMKINRKAAGVVGVLIFVILAAAVVVFCLNKLFNELLAVLEMMPSFLSHFSNSFEGISTQFSGFLNKLPVELSQQLSKAFENMASELMKFSSISSGMTSLTLETLAHIPGILLNIIVSIVAACFISSDYPIISRFILRQLPPKYQDWARDIKQFFFIAVARLIRAYLTLMLITFVELCIWLSALRVPHAIMISALIALVDILPVLGTGTVVIPWAVVELIIGNWHMGLLLILMYAVILVIRNIIEPKIVGYHIGLYPLVTLLALFVGLKAFGAAGMFIFPIIVIIIKHMQDTGKIKIWK